MKLSVSLPDEDVAYVDQYASRSGRQSRSSVFRHALTLLRMAELEDAYTAAWTEWEASEDSQLWDAVVADGITDATR